MSKHTSENIAQLSQLVLQSNMPAPIKTLAGSVEAQSHTEKHTSYLVSCLASHILLASKEQLLEEFGMSYEMVDIAKELAGSALSQAER